MSNQIQDWTRRTQRYWYVDGLAEIGVGIILLLLGIFYWVMAVIPMSAGKPWFLGLGQPLLIIGLAVLVQWIVRRLKEKITFPRTGYIVYRRQEPRRKISGILVAIIVAVALGLVIYISRNWVNLQWLTSISGLFAGLLTFTIAYRLRLTRMYILTAYTLAIGLATSLVGFTDPVDTAVFLGGLGLGWATSGALTLAKYVRNTSPGEMESGVENE